MGILQSMVFGYDAFTVTRACVYACLYALYVYIVLRNYRRAMPTQFNLNFDARGGGGWLADREIRNAHARQPLNRPKLMRVIS